MTGTHTAAACLVERGQTIRVDLMSGETVEGVVRARRNTQRRRPLGHPMLLTHIYFEGRDKLTIGQVHKVTITKEANG